MLILETEFTTADGSAVVLIDFMPLREGRASSHLVRRVIGERGTVPMRTELTARFEYGGWVPWVTRRENGDLLAIAGPDMLPLRTTVELQGEVSFLFRRAIILLEENPLGCSVEILILTVSQ